MVMTHTHAKDQSQTSLGSNDRVETDGWRDRRTEPTALPDSLMWSVITERNTNSCIYDRQQGQQHFN